MIDLNNVKLIGQLLFETDKQDPSRRIGICIEELTPDGKTRRLHRFDPDSGIYKGYIDQEYDSEHGAGLKIGGVSFSYKGKLESGDDRYYKVRTGPIYKVGKREVVSEENLPFLEVVEDEVSLIRSEWLPTLKREPTSREKLEAESEATGESPAEIMGHADNYLHDTAEEAAERLTQEPPESEQRPSSPH